MTKRLAVFTDGTWNEPDSHTNVIDLHDLVATGVQGGIEQLRYYDKGVGTDEKGGERWRRFFGQGYKWISCRV